MSRVKKVLYTSQNTFLFSQLLSLNFQIINRFLINKKVYIFNPFRTISSISIYSPPECNYYRCNGNLDAHSEMLQLHCRGMFITQGDAYFNNSDSFHRFTYFFLEWRGETIRYNYPIIAVIQLRFRIYKFR